MPPWLECTIAACFLLIQATTSLPVEHRGAAVVDCICERRLKPVCANDGKTYENMCQFECMRRMQPALSIYYTGSCCPPATLCPQHTATVCDNYGITHLNPCHFEFQKCLARRMYGVALHQNASADCEVEELTLDDEHPRECDLECVDDGEPFCDDRGKTHRNQCSFEKLLCQLHMKNLSLPTIIHRGECDPEDKFGSSIPKPAQIFGVPTHRLSASEMRPTGFLSSQNDEKIEPPPFLSLSDPYEQLVKEASTPKNVPATTPNGVQSTQVTGKVSSGSTPSPPQQPMFASQPPIQQVQQSQQTTTPASTTQQFGLIDHDSQQPHRLAPSLNESDFKDEECSAVECYRKWEPVCDNRNQTHRNECIFRFRVCKLKKEGVHVGLPEIAYKGQCKDRPSTPTPLILPSPSLSSIQKKLKAHGHVAREGFCQVCNLQEEQQHVCTNENVTFSNACDLAQWNCERRAHGLEEQILVHVGACRNNSLVFTMLSEVCPSTCPRHYKPVCDSDGTTFPNLCTFQMINCHERKMKKADPSWLVALRECPQQEPDVQQKVQTTPVQTNLSSSTPVNGSQVEVVEEHSFVCPDTPCSTEDSPVCDQNGGVHKNECEFTRARCLAAKTGKTLQTVADDQCPARKCRKLNNQSCPTDFDPVCASDFRTLPNLCTFERAKCQDPDLDILFKGECKQCLKAPCPLLDEASADDSQFMCDQNGETKSRCEFEMVRCIYEIKFGYNITPAYEGKCCAAFETCPTQSEPICDTFMKEHRNECYFKIASCRAQKIEHSEPLQILRNNSCTITIAQREISQTPPESSTNSLCQQPLPACTDIYDPVCGSDHRTYPNECQFFQSMCNVTRQKPLKMLYKGACCTDECSDEQAPVCDNENKTHLNLCKFGYERCLADRLIGKNLTVHAYSACQDDTCNSNCPKVYQPVCAKNGKTYINECELKRFNCFAQKHNSTVPKIEIDYPDECCPRRNCPRTFEPVCDTQRKVYANQCEFDLYVCEELKRSGTKVEKLSNVSECFEGKPTRNQTTIHSASYPKVHVK